MFRSLVVLMMLGYSYATHAVDTVTVPAGTFAMGCSVNDANCEKDEGPVGGTTVSVPSFRIDKYEVSVAEFRNCIEAGMCTRPKDHKRNKYCNFDAPERNDHPVNCVDWDQAFNYCRWKNGRLPYEAEWEKAARGGTTSRYPWGEEVTCKQAILDDGVTMGSVKGEPDGCGEDRTWPRGSRPANPLGLFDMHGNAGEWTMNWYEPEALANLYAKGELSSPLLGKQRVVRGGSWDENRSNLRSSFRNVKPPLSGKAVYGSIGFRCAYPDQ